MSLEKTQLSPVMRIQISEPTMEQLVQGHSGYVVEERGMIDVYVSKDSLCACFGECMLCSDAAH